MRPALPAVLDFPHGISAIDSGYQRPMLDAIHLVVEGRRAALVDTGTALSAPRVLSVLSARDIAPGSVEYVFLTHIHLDHAGGAGVLARHLPAARFVIHPRGVRHMTDPAKLVAGTRAVYGDDEFRRHYGEVAPLPAERILEALDGSRFSLGGRELLLFDTPGHARHHYCIHDERSRSVFSGDTFGISYREFDAGDREFIFPTSTPAQFDPQPLHRSIDRITEYQPEQVFLTHFSRVGNPARHAANLHRLLERYVELAESLAEHPQRRLRLLEAMEKLLLDEAMEQGVPFDRETARSLLAMDIDLNVQGIEHWLDTRDRPQDGRH